MTLRRCWAALAAQRAVLQGSACMHLHADPYVLLILVLCGLYFCMSLFLPWAHGSEVEKNCGIVMSGPTRALRRALFALTVSVAYLTATYGFPSGSTLDTGFIACQLPGLPSSGVGIVGTLLDTTSAGNASPAQNAHSPCGRDMRDVVSVCAVCEVVYTRVRPPVQNASLPG